MDEAIALVRSRLPDGPSFLSAPLAREDALASDERRLGFRLPLLLKRLYREIGNGGFGPGYGLIGLSGGALDDLGRTAPEIYAAFSEPGEDDSDLIWPEGLLPICHWGCAIYSCIDCAAPGFPMKLFDPNLHARRDSWEDAFFDEVPSFDEWIEAWARGVDLWEKSYGDDGVVVRELRRR
jgi:hypothetical protein